MNRNLMEFIVGVFFLKNKGWGIYEIVIMVVAGAV